MARAIQTTIGVSPDDLPWISEPGQAAVDTFQTMIGSSSRLMAQAGRMNYRK
jgi:hypothetical protein